jgi:hypothetical protein
LTCRARAVDDGVVRRAIALVILLTLALSVPLARIGAADREVPSTRTEASAQPPRAPEPATISPQAVGVTTSNWLTRVAHDALALHSWSPTSRGDIVFTKSTLNTFPLRTSRSSLTYPLLI